MATYLEIRQLAREMRKNQTPAEKLFWEKVRNRRFEGYKFNRQFIIEYAHSSLENHYFIADFHCHKKKLIVEIDGKIHLKQKEYDNNRTEILNSLGYRVIRFKNEEVLTGWLSVKSRLSKELSGNC